MKPASNTILIANRHAQIRSIEINPRRTTLLVLVGLLVLGCTLLFCGYHYGLRTEARNQLSGIAELRTLFLLQQTEIDRTRKTARLNLDALALRLGQIQARMLRLDALGKRLASQSELATDEFDFSRPPSIGGPHNPGNGTKNRVTDFLEILDELAATVADREDKLAALERLAMNRNLHERIIPSGSAVEHGLLTSEFGRRIDPFSGKQEFHQGIDVAGREGSRILALGDGVVTWSGKRPGYGKLVEISHGDGFVTRYGHNRQLLVAVGATVSKGQTIALMGSTGRSTGPHVHIEVVHNGKQVNPADYLATGKPP
jgi:murein DD-endopeptidase MepM/ murein hydrolase activator NlpD